MDSELRSLVVAVRDGRITDVERGLKIISDATDSFQVMQAQSTKDLLLLKLASIAIEKVARQ